MSFDIERFNALTGEFGEIAEARRLGRDPQRQLCELADLTEEIHPDLLERCRKCGFIALEHDPCDMRCPDDEDEARLNREDHQ